MRERRIARGVDGNIYKDKKDSGSDQIDDANLDRSYDGIQVTVNASDDDFTDSDLEEETDTAGEKPVVPPHLEEDRLTKFHRWRDDPDFQEFMVEVMDNMEEHRAGQNKGRPKNGPQLKNVAVPVVSHKSPSDTTIYKPAFIRMTGETDQLINKISNFVDGMRIQSSADKQRERHRSEYSDQRSQRGMSASPAGRPKAKKARRDDEHDISAIEAAEKEVVSAKQRKAALQKPKGMLVYPNLGNDPNVLKQCCNNDDDDEFFNVTCHIDPNLKQKIERGEYVDLEKLLLKDPSGGAININDESKVELVSKDGHTYFRPVKESQINGLRKWEQAFRVYATVYSQANPERVVEVWQYMHVINVAASAYQWSNVTYYDNTFRQLMAFKPNRSWAETYNQGWNLALKEPLNGRNNSNPTGGQSSARSSSSHEGKKHDWHDDCCWKYNHKKCRRSNCPFDHRCTYCGGWNHGFYNCRK